MSYNVKAICDRGGWVCWLCGKPIDQALKSPHPLSASVDHVIARVKGGKDNAENLRPAHRRCNSSKNKNAHIAKVERIRRKLGVDRGKPKREPLRGRDGQRLT